MFLKNLHLILFTCCMISIGYSKFSTVDSIHIDSKTNGIIVTLNLDTLPALGNYSAWQAKSGWFYITLYEVNGDPESLGKIELPDDIKKIQMIESNESLQIGMRVKNPIENYYFESSPKNKMLVAFLHYSNDYIAELDMQKMSKITEIKRGIPSGVKTWLNITGITVTFSGIISNNNAPINNTTKAGLMILFTSYVLDKIMKIL